jgi:hypothetical protein
MPNPFSAALKTPAKRACVMAISLLLFIVGGYLVTFGLSDSFNPNRTTKLQQNAAEISYVVTGDRTAIAFCAAVLGIVLAFLSPVLFVIAFVASVFAKRQNLTIDFKNNEVE